MSTMTDAWPEVIASAVDAVRRRGEADSTGEAVLDDCRSYLRRFVKPPSEAVLDVMTAWAAHTWVTDRNGRLALASSPRIFFGSKDPASGKTEAMRRMGALCRSARMLADLKPTGYASLLTEYGAGAILVDELDGMIKSGRGAEDVRMLMLIGFEREGAEWMRTNKPPVSVFTPLALAGLSKKWESEPLAALRSRTISIKMVPAAPGDVEEYDARDHRELSRTLRTALGSWVQHTAGQIMELRPTRPAGIHGRDRELCDPLLQIADAAGGHWPVTLRESLRELLLGESVAEPEVPLLTRLLDALEGVFAGTRQLTTVQIVTGLFDIPGAPWRKLWPSDATAPAELRAMLAPLGVKAVPIRVNGSVTRGYKRVDLAEHWDM